MWQLLHTGVSIEQKTCAAPTYAAYSGSSAWTETVNGNTDLNSDGATNATDRSIVVAYWNSAENCAP